MLRRWSGGFAAAVITVLTLGLVALDLTDDGFRRWWAKRALTTDTVAGVLVLLITVLVVDQVARLRRVNDRSRATAAQAAIVVGQAFRSSNAVSSALNGSGDRDAASDEVRTYLTMLLLAAPVLIDAQVPRTFLERAQHLGGELARTLSATAKEPAATVSSTQLDDAVNRFMAAATPLLQILNPEQQNATSGADEPGL